MVKTFFRLVVSIFFWALCWPTLIAQVPKPNIVFLLIDDLAYADCGFNGGKDIQTPRIDRLAKGGTVLTCHYVQPVCSPTRAALMTGRYPIRTGVYTVVRPNAKWGLPLAERTLAQSLRELGYSTNVVGKWHLGEFKPEYLPLARGFDHHYGHYFGALDYYTHLRDGSLDWYRDGKPIEEEGYTTHLLAREACRIINEHDQAKPLFLYVPFNGVHSPLQVPDSYTANYPNLVGNRKKLAGMLAAVDEAVGQIMDSLESKKLRENTLVIFSSDNGGPRPGINTPLRDYKGTIYEGGVRASAFVNWPGKIPSGVRLDEPMHISDWYPTLSRLAGSGNIRNEKLDGKDVWPMLTGKSKSPHEFILLARSTTSAALRMGDWKIIMNPASNNNTEEANDANAQNANQSRDAKENRFVLYNLAKDISESNDLSAKEPERLRAMKEKLLEVMRGAVAPGNEAIN